MSELADTLSEYGITALVCIMFFWQYFKQQSYNEKREDKLYSVIDTMSKTLPELKDKLDQISDDVKELKHR